MLKLLQKFFTKKDSYVVKPDAEKQAIPFTNIDVSKLAVVDPCPYKNCVYNGLWRRDGPGKLISIHANPSNHILWCCTCKWFSGFDNKLTEEMVKALKENC